MRRLFLFLLVFAAGCSRSALYDPGDAGSTDGVMRGTMRPDCAPNDGPAVRFDFAPEAFACGDFAKATLTVSVWSGSPLSAGAYRIGAFGVGRAQAVRCDEVGSCEAATGGALVVERYDEATGAGGTYELSFPSGLTVRGGFSTSWCDTGALCG